MSLRTWFMIVAVAFVVGNCVIGAPRGSKHEGKKGGTKGGKPAGVKKTTSNKGGRNSTQQTDVAHPPDVLPYHYTLSIVPDLDNSTFSGEVIIDFQADRATQEIVLHATRLRIDNDKIVLTERRCVPPTQGVDNAQTVSTSVTPATVVTAPEKPTTPNPPVQPPPVTNSSGEEAPVRPPLVTTSAPSSTEFIAPAQPTGSTVSASEDKVSVTTQTAVTPSATFEASAKPEEAPVTPEKAPVVPEEAPATPEKAPVVPEEAPVTPEKAPVVPEEAPVTPEKAPVVPDEAPAVPDEAPAVPEEAPAVPEEAPAVPEEAPAVPEEAPAVPEEAPVVSEEAPVVSEEAPVVPEEVPDVPEEAPIVPEEASKVSGEVPVTPEETPAIPDKTHDAPEVSQDVPAVSQDVPEESHTVPEESHTVPEESHEPEESHHEPEKSHDVAEESHDVPEESHHEPEESHHEPEKSHDVAEESHHEPEESHHEPEKSHDVAEESHDVPEESHHEPEESHHEPEKTHGVVEESHNVPEESHHEPEESHHEPEKSHDATEVPLDVLEESHGVPESNVIPGKASGTSGDASSVYSDIPVLLDETPAAPEEPQNTPEKTSSESEDAPSVYSDIPVLLDETPAAPEEPQNTPEKTSSVSEDAPSVYSDIPVLLDETPAAPEEPQNTPEKTSSESEDAPSVYSDVPVLLDETPTDVAQDTYVVADDASEGSKDTSVVKDGPPDMYKHSPVHEKTPDGAQENSGISQIASSHTEDVPVKPEEDSVGSEATPATPQEAANTDVSKNTILQTAEAQNENEMPSAEQLVVFDKKPAENEASPSASEETSSLSGEGAVPASSDEDQVVYDKVDIPNIHITSTPKEAATMDKEPYTTTETPTTPQDTFNLTGEAYKILEVLNRNPERVEIIKAPSDSEDSTDEETPVISDEDVTIVKLGEFEETDQSAYDVETRTGDTPLKDSYHEPLNANPSSSEDALEKVPPTSERTLVADQTTQSMFGKILSTIDDVVRTTISTLTVETSTADDKTDVSSTLKPETTLNLEPYPLQRDEALADIPVLQTESTTLSENMTTLEGSTTSTKEVTDLPSLRIVPGATIDSFEQTTETTMSASTTSRAIGETTAFVPTTVEVQRMSRSRRSHSSKRKRRPSNRNKLKQSVKLPQCTAEDMYEVRVDRALSSTRRRNAPENVDFGIEVVKEKIRKGNGGTFVLPIKTPLQAGKRYRLSISFSGKMSHRQVGLYRSDYTVEETARRKSKSSVLTTVFEPTYARRVFPCLDDPRYRARFSVRIAHPPNLSAYSNMPASTTSDDVDVAPTTSPASGVPAGWLWDRFETSPPMPTYLVAFFVGALARKSRTAAGAPGEKELMVRVLARRERLRDAAFALNLAPKVMREMGQWLDRPTSLSKLDLLAMPGPGPDAVENWGLVSFQERYLLTQPGLLSRYTVAAVLSHELAHDWFGNLVTPHHWKYAWLSEGLATYSSARILNKLQPTWDAEDLATVYAYVTAMTADDTSPVPMQPKSVSSSNYKSVFNAASYYKGYMLIRMLNGVLGDETMTSGLRRYVQQNAFGWAKTTRFLSALTEAKKERANPVVLPKSLTNIMYSWVEEPGYPIVTITRNYTSREVFIKQARYTQSVDQPEQNTTWWIPLRTWTKSSNGPSLQWIPPSSKHAPVRLSTQVPIGVDQWIMANAEFSAPMRVLYDQRNWDMLVAALPTNSLPRGAGAQLTSDALALASSGHLPFSVALKVVAAALGARTADAHLTWTTAGPALRHLDSDLRGTKASKPFRQWIYRQLTALDSWISFEPRNDTVPDAVLARHVTNAACSMAMPLCLVTSRNHFRTWMYSNSSEPRVPIELRNALYCAAVRDGSSDTIWRFLWSKLPSASSDEQMRILKAFGCTRDLEQAKKFLQMAFDVKSPVTKKQLPIMVRSFATHDAGPGFVLSYLADNVQRVAKSSNMVRKIMGEIAPTISTKKDLKKLNSLLPQLTNSRTTVARVTAEATHAVERSQRLSQGVAAFFPR